MKQINIFGGIDELKEDNVKMKFKAIKKDWYYIPLFDSDYEVSNKVPNDSFVTIEVDKIKRNGKHHRLFFARLKMLFDNGEHNFPSINEMRKYFCYKTGHYSEYVLDGKVFFEAKSISYKSMGEIEFSELEKLFINEMTLYFGVDLINSIEKELSKIK